MFIFYKIEQTNREFKENFGQLRLISHLLTSLEESDEKVGADAFAHLHQHVQIFEMQ